MSRYRFNRDDLSFFEERQTLKRVFKAILSFIGVLIVVAIALNLLFALLFNSPKEERLERENALLKSEYLQNLNKLEMLEDVIQNIEQKDREIYYKIFKSAPPQFINEHNSNFYSLLDTATNLSLIKYSSEKLRYSQIRAAKIRETIYQLGAELKEGKQFSTLPIALPLNNFTITQTGAGMGMKIHPFYKSKVEHLGIDLLAPLGTEVVAVADGVVKESLRSRRGRGNQITIKHGNNYETYYAHLGDILVRRGERVKRGEVIARVGSSGLSFAPHLHYEVRLDGHEVDPLYFFFSEIDPRKMLEMMFISLNSGQSMD